MTIALIRSLLQLQLVNRGVHVDGVSRVVEPKNGAIVRAHGAKRLGYSGKSEVTVGVLLREDRDLPRLQPAYLDQVSNDGVGFLDIARPVVEDVTIGRIVAQDVGAGEGAEEQHLALKRVGHRHRRRRRPDIADDAEHLIPFVELFHGLGGARGLVAVVGGMQLQHPAIEAAGIVDATEGGIDSELHLPSQFPGGAGERGCDSKPNFLFRDATRERPGQDRRNGSRRRGRRLRRGCGGGGGGADDAGQAWPGDRPFEIGKLAVGTTAIHPARRDHGATVGHAAIEHLREVGTFRLVRRSFPDHQREFVDDSLDARTSDVAAGLRRSDHGSDATGKVTHDVDFTRGAGAVCHTEKQGSGQ